MTMIDPRSYEDGPKNFSQHHEASILRELIRRVDPPRVFIEIGTETGHECNCRWLAERDWRGMFIEARADCWLQLVALHKERLARIHCVNAKVTVENLRSLFAPMPRDLGVLSVDVDGYDYHLLMTAFVNGYRPAIVVVEVNHAAEGEYVMEYDSGWTWDGESPLYGASEASMTALLERNGYVALGTDSTGVNLFAVRGDLADRCE